MDRKSIIDSTLVAFLSQGVGMLLSVIQSLLIPKMLDVAQFGYWQLFIFYSTYVGIFAIGLNDGIYLLKGGQAREAIDKRSVQSQFVAGVAFQSAFALVIIAVALFGGFGPEREFVIAATAIYLVIKNASTYLMYVLQAMNETKRSSYAVIVERLAFLFPLAFLLLTQGNSFRPYVVSYLAAGVVQLLFCLWHVRDFVASGLLSPARTISGCAESMRVGIKLMIANLASQLIVGVARFVIDAVWGIETFGQLSLSLSLVTFFLAFVMSASMVLFPALRQGSAAEQRSFFGAARTAMGLFFPVVYLLYFPMVWLLRMWLPAYAQSFSLFAYLIPICVFDSKMNIVSTTYFKVRRGERRLLAINLAAAIASALMVLASAYLLRSFEAVIAAVVVAIVGRSLVSERIVASELDLPEDGISAGEVVLTLAFVALVSFLPAPAAMAAYGVAYAAFLWLHRARVAEVLAQVRA